MKAMVKHYVLQERLSYLIIQLTSIPMQDTIALVCGMIFPSCIYCNLFNTQFKLNNTYGSGAGVSSGALLIISPNI